MQEKLNTQPIFAKIHIGMFSCPSLCGPYHHSTYLTIQSKDHCIEILRQIVMCHADVGVITYDWVDTFIDPFPDLNIYKKCRNPNRVIEWINRNTLHIDKDHLQRLGNEVPLAMPPDATQLPQWERMKIYHG
jgi:hypothetical protein